MTGLVRATLFNVWFFGWTIVALLFFIPALALPRQAVMFGQRVWARGVNLGMRWLVGLRYEVRGKHHLPPAPRSSHRSISPPGTRSSGIWRCRTPQWS